MINKIGQRDSGIYPTFWPEEKRIFLVFIGKVRQASDLYRLVHIILYCYCLFTLMRQLHRLILVYLIALYQKNQPLLDSKARKCEAQKSKIFFLFLYVILNNFLANFIEMVLVFMIAPTFFIHYVSFGFGCLLTLVQQSSLVIYHNNPLQYSFQF